MSIHYLKTPKDNLNFKIHHMGNPKNLNLSQIIQNGLLTVPMGMRMWEAGLKP